MSYFTGQYGLAKAEKHAAAAVHSAAVIGAMENVTEGVENSLNATGDISTCAM